MSKSTKEHTKLTFIGLGKALGVSKDELVKLVGAPVPTKAKLTAAEAKVRINEVRIAQLEAQLEVSRKAANVTLFSPSTYVVGAPCPKCGGEYLGVYGKNHKFACKYTKYTLGGVEVTKDVFKAARHAFNGGDVKDGHWVPVSK